MTEQELRAIVRNAIAQHISSGAAGATSGGIGHGVAGDVLAVLSQHPSHGLLPVPSGAEADGPCVIEPAVPCNHCGYCQSYGH